MLRRNKTRFSGQFLLATIALIVLAVNVGCDSEGGTAGNGVADSGARQFVTIGTAPAGGDFRAGRKCHCQCR